MFELYLLLGVVGAFLLVLASTVREGWKDYREGRRSLAMALAITCIIAGMPVVFVASALERGGPAELVTVLQVVGIVLVFAGGVLGAVGLVLDRRLRRAAVAPLTHRRSAGGG